MAEVLVYADARGIHSHGAVRALKYYAERISKGGTNREPEVRLGEPDRARQFYMPSSAAGQVAAKMGMGRPIKTSQQKALRWSV
ncbi:Ldh family oxidoreductase [Shigella sonnei]